MLVSIHADVIQFVMPHCAKGSSKKLQGEKDRLDYAEVYDGATDLEALGNDDTSSCQHGPPGVD
jgi:hypothetical protein